MNTTYQPTYQRVGVDSKVYDPEPVEERRSRRFWLLASVIGLLMLCALAMTAGFWFERIGIAEELGSVVAKGFPFSSNNFAGNLPVGAKFIATPTYTATARATSGAVLLPSAVPTRVVITSSPTSVPPTATLIPATATSVPATATKVPPTAVPPTTVPPTAIPPSEAPTLAAELPAAAPTDAIQAVTETPITEPSVEVAQPTEQPLVETTVTAEETAEPIAPAVIVEEPTQSSAPAEGEVNTDPNAMLQATTPTVAPADVVPTVRVIAVDPAASPTAAVETAAPAAANQQQAGVTATPQATATALPQTGGGAQFRIRDLLSMAVVLAVVMLLARWLRTAHQKI